MSARPEGRAQTRQRYAAGAAQARAARQEVSLPSRVRLALVPFNPTIGAIEENAEGIAAAVGKAAAQGADLIVLPELALCGYPPKDLLLAEGFVGACERAAHGLAARCVEPATVVFGTPLAGRSPGALPTNSLLAVRDGKVVARYDKRLLPTYDVFDESRYFAPGTGPCVLHVPVRGGAAVRVGLTICEDLWRGIDAGYADRYLERPDPVAEMFGGTEPPRLIVNPSASPFVLGKSARHREILAGHARRRGAVLAAVNQWGGNDELIFDGRATIVGPTGIVHEENAPFSGGVLHGSMEGGDGARAPRAAMAPGDDALLLKALVLGVRDYCRKTGFKRAVLGLSGGIDSALVAVIAAAALGPESVLGVSMPGRYSSPGSVSDAKALAERLGIGLETISIEGPFAAFLSATEAAFAGKPADVAEENLQSRVRGTLLMALSNKHGHLLLTTGNKSEMAVGYCTLYGDMNGGLAVISDVPKTAVYRLARLVNTHSGDLAIEGLKGPPIPEASITKPPSAELRPNQTDQDTLPPYEVLDEIVERYVERRESPGAMARAMAGTPAATIDRVVRMIDVAEYKRKQAPIGLKVSGVAFGSGRRVPIAQGWRPRVGAGPS